MTIRTAFLALLVLTAVGQTGCSIRKSNNGDVSVPPDTTADASQDIGTPDTLDPDTLDPDTLVPDLRDDDTLELVEDLGTDTAKIDVVEPEDTLEEVDTPPLPDVEEDETGVDVEEDVTVPCLDTDDDPCTGAKLDDQGTCVVVPLSDVACDDKNDCTKQDTCLNGVCTGEAYVCNDSNDCTNDYCKGDGNCGFENNANLCDDGDPCTALDMCALGLCAGTPQDCECKVDGDCGSLEDGNLCNGTLFCDTSEFPYLCKVDALTVKSCPEPNGVGAECLAAACDPATGSCLVVSANEGAACDDGLFCSETSVCENGACVLAAEKCPPADQCYNFHCVEADKACVLEQFSGNDCNDENACTVNDTCSVGICAGVPGEPCNDNNPCTDDSCNPASGCVYDPNSEPCTDGNKCTQGDICILSKCIPGEPVVCNDNVDCTQDVCVPESGCTFITKNSQCDDSNACTVGNVCTVTGCTYLLDSDCTVSPAGFYTECHPELGCLAQLVECGDGNLDAGEECDDGGLDDGDGCDARCHVEKQKFTPPLYPSDIDVTADGEVVAVRMYGPDGVYAQCFNPKTSYVSPKVLWYAAGQDVNVSSDEPWVVRAGNSGESLMVWRHYTVPNDNTSVRLDVVYLSSDCTVASAPTRLTNTNTNEFYDMDIDDNGNGVVAFNMNTRGYLRFFNPDGSPTTAENIELPGPTCKYGIHVALSNLGNGGVVSCQGDLVEGVVFWTFDAQGNLTSTAQPVADAEGHTAWYDSHNCYAGAGGEFVIVNADMATGETRRAQYDRFGDLVRSDIISVNAAPPPACYDSYRFGRIKNNFLDGRVWASVVASGDCFSTNHTRLIGLLLVNPNAKAVVDAPLPLQRMTVDRLGNTYILDNSGDILINHVTLP